MLGQFLRDKRKEKNQTQVEASKEVGVEPQTWSQWERGLRPNLDSLFRIADWAGCKVDDLRAYVEDVA